VSRPLIDIAEPPPPPGAPEPEWQPIDYRPRALRLTQPDEPRQGGRSHLRLLGLLVLVGVAAAVAITLVQNHQPMLTRARAAVEHIAARQGPWPHGYPSVRAMIRASAYLEDRAGYDAFAVVDSTGREYGLNEHRTYVSASVTKSMLLVAYLRALAARHDSLTPASKKLLFPMIHVSDNDTATTVFYRVGDAGLTDVAHAAGMRDFSFGANWANESMSPADMAHFFFNMDSLIPRPFRSYARQLLSGVDPTQSWGIPAAARHHHWRAFFKGGWRRTGDGQLVSQAARLERRGRRIALAVMTVEDPSMGYGVETIEGVASRLLGRSGD
jgi:hypothetical protein